jgi:hypothetical protein
MAPLDLNDTPVVGKSLVMQCHARVLPSNNLHNSCNLFGDM